MGMRSQAEQLILISGLVVECPKTTLNIKAQSVNRGNILTHTPSTSTLPDDDEDDKNKRLEIVYLNPFIPGNSPNNNNNCCRSRTCV